MMITDKDYIILSVFPFKDKNLISIPIRVRWAVKDDPILLCIKKPEED